ncbi:MAG: DUF4131 domain-containing protein, partial [Nitrosomonas sp.]|nr:DUF4131 domain-containing protein [Nitrosomonas sp.]
MLLRLNILAFVLGTGLLQQQAKLPEIIWTWSLLLIAIAMASLWRYPSTTLLAINRILLWIFFLGIGFFWAAAFAYWHLADSLPPEWERQDIQLIGVVANLPQINDRSMRFQFDVEQVLTEDARAPKRIALSWYASRQSDANEVALPAIKAGERWQLTVRLRQ